MIDLDCLDLNFGFTGEEPGSHLKRFTPGHVFSRIGISSSLAGPRLTKLVQQACAVVAKDKSSGVETVDSMDVEDAADSQVIASVGALMAGAAAKRREKEMLFSSVGPCRRALCARRDLAMRKRLRRLTAKVCLVFSVLLARFFFSGVRGSNPPSLHKLLQPTCSRFFFSSRDNNNQLILRDQTKPSAKDLCIRLEVA